MKHRVHDTIELLQRTTPDFIAPDMWSPNSPDLSPKDYAIWSVNQATHATTVGVSNELSLSHHHTENNHSTYLGQSFTLFVLNWALIIKGLHLQLTASLLNTLTYELNEQLGNYIGTTAVNTCLFVQSVYVLLLTLLIICHPIITSSVIVHHTYTLFHSKLKTYLFSEILLTINPIQFIGLPRRTENCSIVFS